MEILNHFGAIAVATALSFGFLVLVFVPMELVFPAQKQQKIFRPHWFLDLCFFLGQYFIWGAAVSYVLSFSAPFFSQLLPSDIQTAIQSQPWWLQAIEVVLLSDFLIYWGHRLQHKYAFLWRFHKVHHSSEHLDWLAAHREHPLDTVYTVTIINLPALIFGFDLAGVAGLVAFRGIWAIYIHSNVRLPLRPIRWLIGAPELHHWHHDMNKDAGNYANLSPLMDIIFGTYVCPDEEPKKLGIPEPSPNHYLGFMLTPILPKSLSDKLIDKEKQPENQATQREG
jgi:sterol desaturase/sphingolipid hydroxylase (fatty acid hydroxylase superfamily)